MQVVPDRVEVPETKQVITDKINVLQSGLSPNEDDGDEGSKGQGGGLG